MRRDRTEFGDLSAKQQQALWEAYMEAVKYRLRVGFTAGNGYHECPLCVAMDKIVEVGACTEGGCPAGINGDGFCGGILKSKDKPRDLARKLAQLEGR